MTSEDTKNHSEIPPTVQGFARYRPVYVVAIIFIFLVGLGIRFYDISDAPLDFHPTRQLYSALKARGMYYQNLETAPEWQRELAVQQWKIQGLIEPPVMERLSRPSCIRSLGEKIYGFQDFSRFSSGFWVVLHWFFLRKN